MKTISMHRQCLRHVVSGPSFLRSARRGVAFSSVQNTEGLTKSPLTEELWRQRRLEKEMYEAASNLDALPAQKSLQTKTPKDSAVNMVYSFSTDDALRDWYTNCWGVVRAVAHRTRQAVPEGDEFSALAGGQGQDP
jgi:hypothetical protein